MPEASGNGPDLLASADYLRAALGGWVFWGLTTAIVVGLCDVLLLSAIVLRRLMLTFSNVDLEPPRWNGLDLLLVWLSFFLCITAFDALLLTAHHAGSLSKESVEIGSVGLLGSANVLAALLIIGITTRRYRQPIAALGVGIAPWGRGVFQGVLTYCVFLPGVYAATGIWLVLLALIEAPPQPQPMVEAFQESWRAGRVALPAIIMFCGVVAAPLFEEFFFRAFLLRWLLVRMSFPAAVSASAAIFAVGHFNVLALGPIFVLGVVLALLYARTGNIWATLGMHAAFNFGQFLLMIFVIPKSGELTG